MVVITTYNRPALLEDLCFEIYSQTKMPILVFDDAGLEYDLELPQTCEYFRFEYHHGKKRYYQMISYIFQELKKREFQQVFFLPDDVMIKPDFFYKSIMLWESILDERKICLSTGHTHNRHLEPCWNKFKPKVKGDVVLSGWNDLCFMAERDFFEALKWDIKTPPANWGWSSSGVGRDISKRLFNLGLNMYHSNESLVEFLNVKTVMHL